MKCCRKSIFVLVLAVAGTGCVEPPPLETDTGSQAIAKGALNTTADYAVHIVGPESQCTGVLVTPRWVLTANHCITGVAAAPFSTVEADWIAEDLDIFIVPNGFSDDDDGTMIMHTNISSGNVIVNKTTAMDLGPGDGYDDAARDLALIRLDSPVPPSVALPLHPPILGVGSCDQQNEFDGLIVGFADTDDRSSKMVDDWERDDSPSTGDVYLTDWMLPIPFAVDPATVTTGVLAGFVGPGSIYTGIEGGDSGGPLVQGDRLCGVASGIEIYGTFSGPWCGPLWMCATIGNIFAAVDSPEATTFLSNNIVVNDTHGTPVFEGECSVGLAADSDGDGVWDGCDPFPFCETNNDADKDGVCDEVGNCLGVPNGLNNDSDGDGFGDACDPCPNDSPSPGIAQDEVGDHDSDGICDSVDNCFSIPNFEQKNSNLAWEEIHTPNDKRGDACEPVPQPAIDVITVDVVMGSADSPGGIETHDITRDTFDLKAHASHGPGFGILQTSINIPFVNPSNPFCAGPCVGFTEFRFCQPGENGPPFCDDVAALDEAQLHPEYASADDEMATDPWHRITLDFGAGPTTRGATLGIDYDDTVTQATWLYDVDADYWISSGAVSVPNHADFSAGKKGTDLDGYLWAHVTTGVGSWQDVGTGLHGSHLANAMEPIDVREQYTIVGDTTMPQYWWEEMLLTWIPRWPERIVDRFMFDRGLVTMTAMQDGGLVSQQAQTAMSSALVWS